MATIQTQPANPLVSTVATTGGRPGTSKTSALTPAPAAASPTHLNKSPALATLAAVSALNATDAVATRSPPNAILNPENAAAFDPQAMREELRQAIEQLNETMRRNARDLEFKLDDSTDRTVITVKNRETGEVIRQIPDEALLHVAHNIEDLKGILFNAET